MDYDLLKKNLLHILQGGKFPPPLPCNGVASSRKTVFNINNNKNIIWQGGAI